MWWIMNNVILEHYDMFECLAKGKVSDNIIHIRSPICESYIPRGFIDKQYYLDSSWRYVTQDDYLSPCQYFTHTNEVECDYFIRQTHLTYDLLELLENEKIHVYEVEILSAYDIKDYTNCTHGYYSWECEKLDRKNKYEVDITIYNKYILQEEVYITTSSYSYDRLFVLSY